MSGRVKVDPAETGLHKRSAEGRRVRIVDRLEEVAFDPAAPPPRRS